MKKLLLASALLAAGFGFVPQAHAQKEIMATFYGIQMAPRVCGWANVADGKKLDSTITAQEQALGVTAAERANLIKQAEADLRSDPSNCAADGLVRSMYDEAVK
jgi:hypothetical protein